MPTLHGYSPRVKVLGIDYRCDCNSGGSRGVGRGVCEFSSWTMLGDSIIGIKVDINFGYGSHISLLLPTAASRN